jgi:hypothetical protein
MEQYWFKSTLFEIESNEDEETNPRIYGKQLANWLKDKLNQDGYEITECFPDDWGWCVIIFRKPFMLFVGCANVYNHDTAKEGYSPPPKDKITWSCFVSAEVPFYKRLFKSIDPLPYKNKLESDIERILKNESEIQLVEEP